MKVDVVSYLAEKGKLMRLVENGRDLGEDGLNGLDWVGGFRAWVGFGGKIKRLLLIHIIIALGPYLKEKDPSILHF